MEKIKGYILITGTSSGVGRATAIKFLNEGYFVHGLDIKTSTIPNDYYPNYKHYICDVSKKETLPTIQYNEINYIMNNAGIVTPQKNAIPVNLEGYINIIEKYAIDNYYLVSLINIGSTASVKGFDNIRYCCSQGGRDALTKWCCTNLSPRSVLCNSINLDGIIPGDEQGVGGTSMEPELYKDKQLMKQITEVSILKKLSTVEEIAEWCYFVLVINKCVTGETINIDGEIHNFRFIKYPGWDK